MASASAEAPVWVRQTSSSKGRALVSARSLSPGATILTTSPALILPSLSHMPSVCTYCLRPAAGGADPLRACTRCRSARYCGPGCQRAHWQAAHSRECRPLAGIRDAGRAGGGLPTPVRLLLQILAGVGGDQAGALGGLEGHVDKWRADGPRWADIEMMAMAASAYAGKGTDEAQVKLACEIMCKIQTNAFNWSDADLGRVAVFLEPTLAMMNHSCTPNAMVHLIGRKVILRAELPIEAGDEIEISYTDYTWPRSKRNHALEMYNFQCQCPRCRDDLNVYQVCSMLPRAADLDRFSVGPDMSQVQRHAAVSDKEVSAAAADMSERATASAAPWRTPEGQAPQIEALRASYHAVEGLVGRDLWAVAPLPQMIVDMTSLSVEREDWLTALATACLVAAHCDPYRYPAPFHPVRVKGLFLIAKLLSNTAADSHLPQPRGAPSPGPTSGRIGRALGDVDQVSLCQMLLIMVLKLAPAGKPAADAEWELSREARDLLGDIAQLPGRQGETSLIEAWVANPGDDKSRGFFKYAVVDPIRALAELGKDAFTTGLKPS